MASKLSAEEVIARGKAALLSDNPIDGIKSLFSDAAKVAKKDADAEAQKFLDKRRAEEEEEEAAQLPESIETTGVEKD